ncbi:hypothetical protein BBP40_010307 [Aspergillus hancockii]|nr:hypothetical protein BBP40_010307 [Aspergillus hancockii]
MGVEKLELNDGASVVLRFCDAETSRTVHTPVNHERLILLRLAPIRSHNSAEYLGPTDFTSTFMEHSNQVKLESAFGASSNSDILHCSESDPLQPHDSDINPPLLQIGTQVLCSIPDEQSCKILFSKHINPNDGWIRLAGRTLFEKMWNSFRTTLNGRRKEHLNDLARLTFKNSMSPLVAKEDPRQWLESFAWKHLRWEALVILFTYFDALLQGLRFLCIELCRYSSSINTLTAYLLYKHNILESIVSGDKSFICWRQHGDLIAVATFLGLHRESVSDSEKVTLQHEMKRRVYAAVFNIDKVLSTFTGRPPLLNRLHSSTKLPLDLSDDDLLSDHLQESVAKLDTNRWNQDGRIYSTTILRARTMFSKIRDEILEITSNSAAEYSLIVPYALYAQILTRLELLLNRFLLERLLVGQNHAQQDLVDVSQEMLKLTLIFWKNQDHSTGLHSDFEWLAMSYAVPSSGILCLELLRQASHPQTYSIRFPRSVVIQNLSLLAGFLDCVRPTASSRDLNLFIIQILRRVLDRILDMRPMLSDPVAGPHSFLDPYLQNGSYEGPDNHNELLNTFDWLNWDADSIDAVSV